MGAEHQARACLASCGPATPPALRELLRMLQRFAGASGRRCQEQSLAEAGRLLPALSQAWAELGAPEAQPFLRCLLSCQLEAMGSLGAFRKLEKILATLTAGRESVACEEVARLLDSLTQGQQALALGDLRTVCLFLEESSLAREHWRRTLDPLLGSAASTLASVLQDPATGSAERACHAVKLALQLFQAMPEEVGILVWSPAGSMEPLASILQSLVQVIMGKVAHKDARLLAGTALGMLVNTAPTLEAGARAVSELLGLLSPDPGDRKLGGLQVAVPRMSPDGLEYLVLSRGLLTSCRREILTFRPPGGEACLLLGHLMPPVGPGWSKKNMDYRASLLQAFSLWLRRVHESAPGIWTGRLLSGASLGAQQLIQFIWSNTKSPLEGLSEATLRSFSLFLELYGKECDHLGDDAERPLYDELLERVRALPWPTKARYPALCALLPFLGSERVLTALPALPKHLLLCLSTNPLSPPAADTYRCFLRAQRGEWAIAEAGASEAALAEQWAQHWLPAVAEALQSPVAALQGRAASSLLPHTLQLFPASARLLEKAFAGPGLACLRGWAALQKTQKELGQGHPAASQSPARLASCLACGDEAVRLAGAGLLCGGPGSAQAPGPKELATFQDFLGQNLSGNSASFRQLLQATVSRLLGRLRDSALAVLRSQGAAGSGPPPESLLLTGDFVEWLLQLTVSQLGPASGFQRRRTALLLLTSLLATCTDSWSPERKKGQPPPNMAALLSWAKRSGRWDFTSRATLLALFSCLQDSTSEIREPAASLLHLYFPPTLPTDLAGALLERACQALSSARGQEVEAGALMMQTLLQKANSDTLQNIVPRPKEEGPTLGCPSLIVISYLLRLLQERHAAAQQDLLQAACVQPLHGPLCALRRCLLEAPSTGRSMQQVSMQGSWQELLMAMVTMLAEVASFLLAVLQGSGEDLQPAAAPSLADMGVAINAAVWQGRARGLGSEEEEEGEPPLLLSEEQGCILTCCWISAKEIGLLLGGLAEKVLLLAPPAAGLKPMLLSMEGLQTTVATLQGLLLRCRHWGALEGCASGLTMVCRALLSQPDPELQELPQKLLAQGLELLRGPRNSSVTRRAAGFPLFIQCIVAGEPPTGTRPLLTCCVGTLLELANRPLPRVWDQTLDLPQVSALHVLQALVRGAGLGAPMLEWAGPLLELCLGALGSPCWAMRNAGTQLFGALMGRLLGQSLSREDSGSHKGLSPDAFFTLYPPLEAVLLAPLLSSLGSTGESHLCPALHAVLTLLAKLQPGTEHLSSSAAHFQERLLHLSASPVYATRAMAAQALVPFVPLVELEDVLLHLLQGLAEPGPHNTLHGRLLQACALLAQESACQAFQGLQAIVHQAEAAFWLLTPAQRCPLIRSAYLRLLSLLTDGCSKDFLRQVEDAVAPELGPSGPDAQVGASVLRQESARFLCRQVGRLADPSRTRALGSLLRGSDPEVRQAILAWVLEEGGHCEPVASVLRALLLETLWPVLQEGGSPEGLKLHLEALVHLHEDPSAHTDQLSPAPPPACLDRLLSLVEMAGASSILLGRALCVLSLLLALGPEDLPALGRWSLVVECWSEPRTCEELRLAAAQSLRLAGVRVVVRAWAGSGPSLAALALRLLNAGIFLLQDEDRTVRLEASMFASLLAQQMGGQPWEAGTMLQANQGLLLLLQVIGTHFGACEDTWPLLMLHLPQCDLEGLLEEVGTNRPPSLYEEDGANFFAEPAVFAQVLLPFLLQLLDRAEDGAPLRAQAQQWAASRAPAVLRSLQHCCLWWSQDNAGALFLKALGCPKVHTALTVLLVEAELLVQVLEALQASWAMVPGANCSSQELRQAWGRARALLTQHGMAPQMKDSQRPGPDKRPHTLIDGTR
ncbi:thyroid adenoma-associated protein homolog [Trichosurus vulpecula]|uniref:thyroid adenoma-associated protein homolog n=1 Tax=Trichosurus vulpecula TaxID=9337 RepID=UPI00186AFBD6|nr:thyroid adenoma-associated protein homolog [Trichosurus vulpecula]